MRESIILGEKKKNKENEDIKRELDGKEKQIKA